MPTPPDAKKWTTETFLSIHYWCHSLLSFRTTRPESFSFTAGQYVRLGLTNAQNDIVWRPYSIVSGTEANFLEFIATPVPKGEFSELLIVQKPGDPIHVNKTSLGFLTVDQLAPGKELWLLASGSGLGPFVSILQEAAVWENFSDIFLIHSVRQAEQLAYRQKIGMLAQERQKTVGNAHLSYLPLVTREPGISPLQGRLTQLIRSGALETHVGTALNLHTSRIMVCGNPEMCRELRDILSERGFSTTRRGIPGQMAFEKYW